MIYSNIFSLYSQQTKVSHTTNQYSANQASRPKRFNSIPHISRSKKNLQEPSISTILARRGTPRPTLKRNDSSFTAAVSRAANDNGADVSRALELVALDPSQKDTVKKDLKLVVELQSEQIPATSSAEKIPVSTTPNGYETR